MRMTWIERKDWAHQGAVSSSAPREPWRRASSRMVRHASGWKNERRDRVPTLDGPGVGAVAGVGPAGGGHPQDEFVLLLSRVAQGDAAPEGAGAVLRRRRRRDHLLLAGHTHTHARDEPNSTHLNLDLSEALML